MLVGLGSRFNFYYCRCYDNGRKDPNGQEADLISTIVDLTLNKDRIGEGQEADLISTIVDVREQQSNGTWLGSRFNFYYCR